MEAFRHKRRLHLRSEQPVIPAAQNLWLRMPVLQAAQKRPERSRFDLCAEHAYNRRPWFGGGFRINGKL